MARQKRRGARTTNIKLSAEIIAAWMACDESALFRLLHIMPWEHVPLPLTVTPLGVDPEPVPGESPRGGYAQAREWQRKLVETVGWPDLTVPYETNLKSAIEDRDRAQYLVDNPREAGLGTGTDPASLQRGLEAKQAMVDYRRELLDDLKKPEA